MASSCFTRAELRVMLAKMKARLLQIVGSGKPKEYFCTATFSGLELDSNELKELLN
jgi:hypothetical protein